MNRVLMKGNEAIGEGAVRAGCRFFFGYPITPQSELTHFLARRLPQVGGLFLQAESEVASINMVYGAAGAGARAMTSSSGPGISLMQEGLSYLAGAELPCVIVNMMRGGPGLGNIAPAQSDYYQATRGGGHGDYRLIALAPNSIQEIMDIMKKAFDLADQYRNPVMIMADGVMAQMMEPVVIDGEYTPHIKPKPWAASGRGGRINKNLINSCFVVPEELEKHNLKLADKYNAIINNEQQWDEYQLEDAEIVIIAFGTASRICLSVIDKARSQGIPVGLLRPITLWPFPTKAFNSLIGKTRCLLTVEMNMGQMVDDVRLTVGDKLPVHHYGRAGGMVPSARDILLEVLRLYNGGVAR